MSFSKLRLNTKWQTVNLPIANAARQYAKKGVKTVKSTYLANPWKAKKKFLRQNYTAFDGDFCQMDDRRKE